MWFNNNIYNKEKNFLSEYNWVYLVIVSIIVNLGIFNLVIFLNKEDLKFSDEVY